MAFLTYKKTVSGSTIRYEQLTPLKLGGRTGLIAQHVKTLSDETARSWQIDTAALLKLAGNAAVDVTVLFDVTGQDSTSVCLYELVKIHGSCRDTSTQLALDMAVVLDQEIGDDAAQYAKSFEIPVPEKPRQLGETLSLSGGPGGGDWKWGTPPMQLGATVVHGHAGHGHGHGGGEPCGNCTCGRRAVAQP
jgi:hypothetical protein